ncbi:MAG: phage tail tape measure protein [Desulfovibrionaceae bacterium]|nr:MAG: phage tail tape measure protein [Desulfovibrionaceae bacterium]
MVFDILKIHIVVAKNDPLWHDGKRKKTSTRTGGHMSQLQTKIIINGQDNASKAFKSAERSAAALREGVQELAGSLTRFFGLSATVGSFTVFGKASLDAALNLDRLNKAFSTIEGSSARGAARLDYLREVSDRLGQNFYQTAEAAKGFFAATKGTQLEGDAERIFEGFTEASTALGLTTEQYNRVLLAIQQMISKGKISAEELRQQLGEALPKAVQIFAQALGVETSVLDKMLERGEVSIDVLSQVGTILHKDFGEAAINAANGVQGELNRLTSSWEDFKASFMDSDIAASSLQTVRGAVESMTAGVEEYDTALKASVPALAAFIAQHKLMNTSLAQGEGIRKNAVAGLKNLTLATREAADAEIIRLEREKLALVQNEKRAAALAARLAGTENAARAEQVLANVRARLLTLDNQLNAAEKKLSGSHIAAVTSLEMLKKAGLGVRSAFSSLLGIFGGPWGAAFTAAVGSVSYLSMQEAVAEKYAREHADALRLVSANTREAGDALKEYADKLNEMNKNSFELEGINLKQQIEEQLSGNFLEGGAASRIRAAFSDFWTSLEDAARLDKMTEILLPKNFVNATSEQLKMLKDDLQAYAVEKEKALEFKDVSQVLDALISLKIKWEEYQSQISKTRDATESSADSTNRFSRELAALDKAGGQFVTSASDAISWLDRYTANTALAKETSAAFERTQREVALALIQSTAAVAAGMGQWETYERLMRAADEYQKRFAQVDAGKTGGSGKTEAQRRAEAALKALEGYNRELEKLKSTDAEFRDWELKRWVEKQIDLYPQYKKKIEEVAAARRESWAEEDRAEAERKARENSDLRLDFYQQLAEKSGQYNLSLEYANQLIDRQMEEWKNADIPREYLDQMRELLRLEAGTEGWDGAKRAMKSYYADATNMGRQFESFTQTSLSSLEDALVEFTTTGKLSFSDLADSMIRDLVRIAYQAMVVAPLVQSLTGMFGGGSLIKQALSASNAAVNAMFTPSAQGNVFSGGSISDYSGSVVSSPTTFDFNEHLTAFRKGAGLMGEAGPEAVMPLTRGPDGTLGVRSYTPDFSMPTPEVTVNVINNTGQQVQAQTTAAPDGQGGLNIEVVLDQVEAGMVQRDNAGRSRFANHLDRTRGLSRAGRLYRGRGKS